MVLIGGMSLSELDSRPSADGAIFDDNHNVNDAKSWDPACTGMNAGI